MSNTNALAHAILFETEENAQKVIDEHFPGHTTELLDDGTTEVRDAKRKCVIRIIAE